MRVDQNKLTEDTRFLAQQTKDANKKTEDSKKQVEDGALYAGNMNLCNDTVEQKRKAAQVQAMKLMEDVFGRDQDIDRDLEERGEHIEDLRKEWGENNAVLQDIAKERENLKAEYGIEDENTQLDEEQQKEYQQQMAELATREQEYQSKADENMKDIINENYAIRDIKTERLKGHDMVDAGKQADDIMAAASREIQGMLIRDVKDNIDEKMEETKDKAEEAEEKKEELEERLEKAKQERKEDEKMYEMGSELNDVRVTQQQNSIKDVQKSVDQIVGEMMLTRDDIKGAAVDKTV